MKKVKRIQIAILVMGIAAMMAGCTPPEQFPADQESGIEKDVALTEESSAAEADATETDDDKEPSEVADDKETTATEDESGDAGVEFTEGSSEKSESSDALDTASDDESDNASDNASDTDSDTTSDDATAADSEKVSDDKKAADSENESEDSAEADSDTESNNSSDTKSAGTIQSELAEIEKKHQEIVDKDWDSMPQQTMNLETADWYALWDEELNSLWSRIIREITPEEKEKLLEDQRKWIIRKEKQVKAAGNEALGGTLQPQLENGTAMRYTRKRVYQLAEILAEVKGEKFEIPDEVKESYADVDVD